jgi:hypothetical protein
MDIFVRNELNQDSLKKVLILIDSAISIKNNYSFYYNKYIIERKLHNYPS